MLALARKVNQSIVIGNDIEVTLLEIKGDQIKIGINAPKSVPIYRKEIFAQIQEENKSAMHQKLGSYSSRKSRGPLRAYKGINYLQFLKYFFDLSI